ncbi:hypothetical protein EYF80_034267 [Liparis tanakae]|uniref:Uncharacterized protein n=1 Tax=Liparis tanakae TaxID=230148 RepID=A0A4Z2GQZ6_9TELE|nr:hypothetical protein EYF80_034267 [Liparis tanakae]
MSGCQIPAASSQSLCVARRRQRKAQRRAVEEDLVMRSVNIWQLGENTTAGSSGALTGTTSTWPCSSSAGFVEAVIGRIVADVMRQKSFFSAFLNSRLIRQYRMGFRQLLECARHTDTGNTYTCVV